MTAAGVKPGVVGYYSGSLSESVSSRPWPITCGAASADGPEDAGVAAPGLYDGYLSAYAEVIRANRHPLPAERAAELSGGPAWCHQLTGVISSGQLVAGHGVRGGKAMIATLRRVLIAVPARLVSHGGQLIMRLAPGEYLLPPILAAIRALPAPAG
jgi:hypothetical protein